MLKAVLTVDGTKASAVVTEELPPFVEGKAPEILVWGARYFVPARETDFVAEPDEAVYREAFVVALVGRAPRPAA